MALGMSIKDRRDSGYWTRLERSQTSNGPSTACQRSASWLRLAALEGPDKMLGGRVLPALYAPRVGFQRSGVRAAVAEGGTLCGGYSSSCASRRANQSGRGQWPIEGLARVELGTRAR